MVVHVGYSAGVTTIVFHSQVEHVHCGLPLRIQDSVGITFVDEPSDKKTIHKREVMWDVHFLKIKKLDRLICFAWAGYADVPTNFTLDHD